MNGAQLLLDSTAKISVVVALALGAMTLLRRQPAAARHWLLAVALGCAASLPLLQMVVPASHPIPGTAAWLGQVAAERSTRSLTAGEARSNSSRGLPKSAAPAAQDADGVARSPTRLTLGLTLSVAWFAGLALGLCVLLSGLIHLIRLSSRSRPLTHGRCLKLASGMIADVGLRRPVQLLETDHSALPLTWGLVRPKILLPLAARHWPDELCRIVLAHELAHIRRNDWTVQLCAECLRYVYWFNPLVWIAATRLRQESELACDDAVLQGGVSGSDYAAHLLNLARAARTSSRTAGVGDGSSLESRKEDWCHVGPWNQP